MTSQSARNTAILAALHTHYFTNGTGTYIKKNDLAFINFLPILTGLLLCLVAAVLVMVIILLREKRKRIQEATSLSNLPWIETLEVFTVGDTEGAPGIFLPSPHGPQALNSPPAYETVVKVDEKDAEAQGLEKSNAPSPRTRTPQDDLPSYDVAVKMDGNL